jgi:hypothetical protein
VNRDCEALLEAYGALQECQPNQQAEKKAAYDAALAAMANAAGCSEDKLRAFVSVKWNQLRIAEAKRKGIGTGGPIKNVTQGPSDAAP